MTDLLYIIDMYALIFQVYHAIPEMTGPKGQPTNAVFGFTRDILTIQNKQPTHLICALDSAGPGERNGLFADYKANRGEMPDDLEPQVPMILQVLQGFRVPVLEHAGWEADDVIATLTRKAAARGFEVRIVSNDKDVRQLIGPHVQLYNVRKDAYLDEAGLLQDWGVRPDQVIDFQALVGDSVDNVPGVPLVGPKKAGMLLDKFGTLEEVIAHADEAPGPKLRQNLKEYAEQARLSRKLVTLKDDLPLEIDWEAARVHQPDRERLLHLFTEFGFRRFAEEMRSPRPSSGSGGSRKPVYEVVDSPQTFQRFLSELKQQQKFCVDLETTDLDAVRAEIVGWAFCWEAHRGYYLPVQGPSGEVTLDAQSVLDALRPVLEDPEIEVVNQNLKYELVVLKRAGCGLQGIGMDPMVGDYLLDAGARSHSLDKLAEKYLKHRTIPISDLIGTGKQQKKMFEVDIEKAAEYAVEDADVAWQLAERIAGLLRKEGLWDLYWNLERPLIPVLADMEFTGIKVDVSELRRQSRELTTRLKELVAEIHETAGREFNIASPKQLREVLFEDLSLPVLKRTKTGPSTDQNVLEQLALEHPLPAKIIEHRRLSKLKGTYLDALPEMVNPETGRIHASFNQVVAATGRLSSSEPNLQNIPIRTEEGRRIRKAFVPGHLGWKLLCADYSQIELRLLAHFSGDSVLREAFQEGADIHTAVAADIFGTEPEAVNSEMRRVAKAVNFGVIYGQSPFGLSAALGISQEEAAEFIESYFQQYAGVDRYLQELLQECAKTGFARTILGRRRAITGVREPTLTPGPSPSGRGVWGEGHQRNLPERTAINTVVQGSAADLIKTAMIHIHQRLARENRAAKMLLQIHDELIFEVPADEIETVTELVRQEMESALPLRVPLVVDVKLGDNWHDAEAV